MWDLWLVFCCLSASQQSTSPHFLIIELLTQVSVCLIIYFLGQRFNFLTVGRGVWWEVVLVVIVVVILVWVLEK